MTSLDQIAQALAEGGALHELSKYKQFIIYKLVPPEPPEIKWKKLPCDPTTGHTFAKGSDWQKHPEVWVDWFTAYLAALSFGDRYGVGFLFTELDDLFFVDVDGCVNPDGSWSPMALDAMSHFPGCVVELSHSQRGIHIFGTHPALPAHGCRDDAKGLEFYHTGRFVALTGNCLSGSASVPGVEFMQHFINTHLPPADASEMPVDWVDEACEAWDGPEDDAELIEMALRSKRKIDAKQAFDAAILGIATPAPVEFKHLWFADDHADILADRFPGGSDGRAWNGSAADQSFANALAFWTGKNPVRMDRLMRESQMCRAKWDREDYLPNTIEKAIQSCKSVLGGSKAKIATELPVQRALDDVTLGGHRRDGGGKLLMDQMLVEYFADCVYIQELNKIAMPDGSLLDRERFNVVMAGPTFVTRDGDNAKTTDKAWDAFTMNQSFDFPKAHRTCFRPEETGSKLIVTEGQRLFNRYVPIETKRIAGDPGPFLELVEKLLPLKRDRDILITYMASLVRNPGEKFQWWPVLQGTEGNGKTALLQAVEFAVGSRYSFMPNTDQMADSKAKFNGWIEGKLFIGMEEINVGNRRDFIEAFKPWVTNRRMMVEAKGVDQAMIDNRANGMMTTNHRDGLPLTQSSRRYAVFFTAQQSKADKARDGLDAAFFSRFYDWFYGKGTYAAMGPEYGRAVINDYLRTCEIVEAFNPATQCADAPETSSTLDAIRASLGKVEQEIIQAAEQGESGFCGGWISSMAVDKMLEAKRLNLAVNKRREAITSLGYIPHPGLNDGRVNNMVEPDKGKPRLYLKEGHLALNLTSPVEIARAYSEAQKAGSIFTANFEMAQK